MTEILTNVADLLTAVYRCAANAHSCLDAPKPGDDAVQSAREWTLRACELTGELQTVLVNAAAQMREASDAALAELAEYRMTAEEEDA